MNCVICGKESGKGKTCSSACRKKLSRSVTKGVTNVTVEQGVTQGVTVWESEPGAAKAIDKILESESVTVKPANHGQPDCAGRHCRTNRTNGNKHTINHGQYKPAHLLGKTELNRVTLPGDTDYHSVAGRHPEWPRVAQNQPQAVNSP